MSTTDTTLDIFAEAEALAQPKPVAAEKPKSTIEATSSTTLAAIERGAGRLTNPKGKSHPVVFVRRDGNESGNTFPLADLYSILSNGHIAPLVSRAITTNPADALGGLDEAQLRSLADAINDHADTLV